MLTLRQDRFHHNDRQHDPALAIPDVSMHRLARIPIGIEPDGRDQPAVRRKCLNYPVSESGGVGPGLPTVGRRMERRKRPERDLPVKQWAGVPVTKSE